jgi:hypothetical protein
MDIDHLIQQLAERAQPVSRLLAPWRRTSLWLGASLAYVGIVVAAHLLAGGGLPGSIEPRLVLELAAILATAITAAIAAFSSVVPGRDRRLLLLPLIPLKRLATLGHSCPQDWRVLGQPACCAPIGTARFQLIISACLQARCPDATSWRR